MQLSVPVKAVARLKSLFGKPEPIAENKAPSPLRNIMDNPQDYKLEIYFEGDDLVARLRPRRRYQYKFNNQARKKQGL